MGFLFKESLSFLWIPLMPSFSYNRILRNSGLSLGLSLLFFFSQSVGFAQSVNEDIQETPLTLSDLTPEGRLAVSNLAVSFAAASIQSAASTGDYDATISANVSSILSLLQSVIKTFTSTSGRLTTTPYANSSASGSTLGAYLGWGMYDGYPGLSASPSSIKDTAYLYEIQRALFGQSGVPSANQALLPFLYSAYGFTNALYTSDAASVSGVSVADMLEASRLFFSGFESPDTAASDIADVFGLLSADIEDLYSFLDFYSTASYFVNHAPPSPYEGSALYVQEGVLNDVWRVDGSYAASDDSAIQVVDPLVAGELRYLQPYLTDIRDAIEGLSGGSSGSYSITNTISYDNPGSDDISEGQFGLSAIGVNLRESYGSLLTNRIPASIGAVNTNEIFALTNAAMAAMPNLAPVQTFIQDSLSPFDYQNVGTGPEIRIFQTFTHDGITIPGMSLDLSDTRLTLLRERCNWLARLSYGLLFLVLTILRIRSFLDYVVAGFSSIYGGEIEASSSAEGFDA